MVLLWLPLPSKLRAAAELWDGGRRSHLPVIRRVLRSACHDVDVAEMQWQQRDRIAPVIERQTALQTGGVVA